jgi:site-specific DNA-cytosine methylase
VFAKSKSCGAMKILVAFECSGVVRRAFRNRGHDAWSLDLKPAKDNSPFHIQDDFFNHIGNGGGFDMLIAHPECTFLTVAGLHWNKRGRLGPDGRPRSAHTADAIENCRRILNGPFEKIVLENPIGCLSTAIRKPDQIIQPYQFGDDASKATCLWLVNLSKLAIDPSMRRLGRKVEWPLGSGKIVERWSNQTDSGQNKLPPSPERAALRSETYAGIANAFAMTWG